MIKLVSIYVDQLIVDYRLNVKVSFLQYCVFLSVTRKTLALLLFRLNYVNVKVDSVSRAKLSELQSDPLLNRPKRIKCIEQLGLVFSSLEAHHQILSEQELILCVV